MKKKSLHIKLCSALEMVKCDSVSLVMFQGRRAHSIEGWRHRNCVLGWKCHHDKALQSISNVALFFVSHSCNQRPEDGFIAVARNKIELGLVFVGYSVC